MCDARLDASLLSPTAEHGLPPPEIAAPQPTCESMALHEMQEQEPHEHTEVYETLEFEVQSCNVVQGSQESNGSADDCVIQAALVYMTDIYSKDEVTDEGAEPLEVAVEAATASPPEAAPWKQIYKLEQKEQPLQLQLLMHQEMQLQPLLERHRQCQ